MRTLNTDILIIGGGIAGLWLHHRLNDLGFYAILIDKAPIGNGQTLSSQGIIHGGAKYTLHGLLSNAASAIADMPKRWLDCLDNKGEINLSDTIILTPHQLMWSTKSLSGKLTSFFSSKALNGKMIALEKTHYPVFFKHPTFNGNLYQLNEPVLDIPSLIKNLSEKWRHRIFQSKGQYDFQRLTNGGVASIFVDNKIQIHTQEVIFSAGEGNEALIKQLTLPSPAMQRRPLKMVLIKKGGLPHLYAHCIGASTKPIVTITTHKHSDGDDIWYVGGSIAENGVDMDDQTLITKTQLTLKKILPWIDLSHAQWSTHSVNRAEPAQKSQLRPDTAFVESINNIHIAWPTKLALTPNLSDQIITRLQTKMVPRQDINGSQLSGVDLPYQLSDSLWERSRYAKN
jgi:glycerol-3-phosphate dehydrogenase